MARRQSAAFIAARARLDLLLEQTVPKDRRSEVSAGIAAYAAAAVRDDRADRPGQELPAESKAVFEEIFGDGGVFDRIFGKAGVRR